MFHRHGLCPLLSMPSESIANHASSTPSHHPRTEPEYIPIMMRIIPRCPGKRLLDDDCGCNAKTKNISRLRELKNMRQRRCTSGIKFALRASKQKTTIHSKQPRLPHKRTKNITLVLPSKLSKRAVLGQQTGQAAQVAAGHLAHAGSVLPRSKNPMRRHRSISAPHSLVRKAPN